MTYKLIQECGLKTYQASVDMGSGQGFCDTMIRAGDLEAFLSKAVRVYGSESTSVSHENIAGDTHSGLLINYKPIPKLEPVSAEEVIWALRNADQKGFVDNQYQKLVERLEKAGVAHGK